MQVKLEFTLTFDSDWHINAGFGTDGKADAVIERDAQHKPIISGATLKGVFRDALHDLALNLGQDPAKVTERLGSPSEPSRWYFNAASPKGKSISESVIATGVRVDPRFRRAEDNKYFQRELGVAESFEFSVIGTVTDDAVALQDAEWLVGAAAYIERLGGRRRRGNGKCVISLTDPTQQDELLKRFENRHCGGSQPVTNGWKVPADTQNKFEYHPFNGTLTHRYRIILYTERPVIVAEKPEAGNVYRGQLTIPGSTLRGAFAELAHPNELTADQYKQFKELFLLGRLRFSHLNPLSEEGIPFVQVPLGLQKKEENAKEFTSVFQVLTEQKGFSGWIPLQNKLSEDSESHKTLEEENKISSTEPHPHVRIDPNLKRASDGDLYTYEAIPAGRYYVGELYLEDDDWQHIGNLLQINLGHSFELRIGKGRNRSYGQVKVVILPMTEDDPPTWIHNPLKERLKATEANELFITLASDTIVQDEWGRFYGRFDPQWLAQTLEIKEGDVEVIATDNNRPAQVVRSRLVDSFDARSGLPRWRDKALIAGSTARLVFRKGKRPSVDMLKQLEAKGMGLRRGEGFGRVVFNHPAITTQWIGFASTISIPKKLLDPSQSTPDTETNEDFHKRWKAKISAKIQGISSESICRSLARQLIEYPTIDKLIQELESTSTKQSEKSAYEEYKKAASSVVELLKQAKNEGERRRKAVVLLAEALMNHWGKA